MEKLTTLLENVSNWVKNSVTLKLMTYDFNALPEGQRVLKNASFLIQLLMKNISFMKFFKLFFILFSSIYSLQAQHVDYQKPVNPFKLYSPSFSEARENNNKYQEWSIQNIGGVHKRKIFYNNDSIACVVSGQKELPIAADFFACYTFPLLKNIKKLKIGLVYGFLSYQNTDLSFSVIFNNKTALLKEKKIILEPTFSFNDKNSILKLKEIELNIPKLSNNFIIKIETKGKTGTGMVTLGNCDIELDDRKLQDQIIDQSSTFSISQIKKIKKNVSKRLRFNKPAKILGIGESLHGSKEFEKQSISIIKKSIKNNYNILALEASPVFAYKVNQYVHGQLVDINSVMEEMKHNGYNTSSFIALLNFIKSYNTTNNNKVSITGFDAIINENYVELFKKVVSFFPESKELQKCLNFLKSQGSQIEKRISLKKTEVEEINKLLNLGISKLTHSTQVWQKYIYHYLLESLNNSRSLISFRNYLRKRDSIMANNVFFLANHLPLDSKILLTGHLGHIAKNKHKREKKGPFTSSMGYYLSQKFKEKYVVIGLYAGKGLFWAKQYKGYNLKPTKGEYPVSIPIGKSIEQLCTLLGKSTFYISNINKIPLLDSIIYERLQGVFYEPMQFEPVDLRNELDVIWFTKKTKPNEYPIEN